MKINLKFAIRHSPFAMTLLLSASWLFSFSAFSQWTTNTGTNISGSYGFFTNSAGTNAVPQSGFFTNRVGTNAVTGYGYFTNGAGTNATGNYGFFTNSFGTNRAGTGYTFSTTNGTNQAGNGYSFTGSTDTNSVGNSGFTQSAPSSGRYMSQPTFSYYTFGAGIGTNTTVDTNGVWLYTSTSPTNGYSLISFSPIYQDTSGSNINVRDTFVCEWQSNGVPFYILSYTTHYGYLNSSKTPGPGIATSLNGSNFTWLGYVNLSTNFYAQWSPKFAVNATNGLLATVGLSSGVPNATPTNASVFDVNITNLLQWSNGRVISKVNSYNGESSAGTILYVSNCYYYFSSAGDEFTNLGLSSAGWGIRNAAIQNQNMLAGPTVFYSGGLWFWFTTDSGLNWISSPDLLNWTPNLFVQNQGITPNNIGMPYGEEEGSIVLTTNLVPRF